MNALDQLRQMTTVVADTGDIESIKRYKPQDATTNPSLILGAVGKAEYNPLFDEAVSYGKQYGSTSNDTVALALRRVYTNFGREILKIIDGRVSTEVDARLSFDTPATIDYARSLIGIYTTEKIERERVLIKIASTWEGIQAAEHLEKEGIHCNMTLVFHFAQASLAAIAGATLISPFVGRILDWYKTKNSRDYSSSEDPGVLFVTTLYHFLKGDGYKIRVMGASFRNVGEILELAGCDLLTIGPTYLGELQSMDSTVERKLSPETVSHAFTGRMRPTVPGSESAFRGMLAQSAMATELLDDGIRRFSADTVKLEDMIREKLTV